MDTRSMSGVRKTAIFLLSLEQDVAAQVMKEMDKGTVEQVSLEIARIDRVTNEEREAVLEEFYNLNMAQTFLLEGGVGYARGLLSKALSPDEAAGILQTLDKSFKAQPFHFLSRVGAENIRTFIQDELPQTIGLVLAHLSPEQASEILSGLKPEKQLQVIKRLATMENTSPEVVDQVEASLESRLSMLVTQDLKEIGGVKTVAELLNVIDRATEKSILENLEEEDPELVDQIKRLMFVFEDILLVNDKGIQNVLKEVDNEELALALKTASDELKEKIFKNMSERASELIREEMEYMGPVRIADVEAAQQTIVDVVRRLEESGDVIIQGRSGESEVIV
ncbi:MAG: flagellar motor switch protein FliG [Planctomycetes bacterium]|nr:flagellar motor switch protein FliG [Planctomycetota bacterium]